MAERCQAFFFAREKIAIRTWLIGRDLEPPLLMQCTMTALSSTNLMWMPFFGFILFNVRRIAIASRMFIWNWLKAGDQFPWTFRSGEEPPQPDREASVCSIRDGGGNCKGVILERLFEEVHGFSLFLRMGGRGDFLSLHLGLALELHTLLMSFRRALSNGSVTEANWREPRILS